MEGEVDPVRDLDIINEELRLKDEEYFNKVFEELDRKCVRGSEKKLKPEYVRNKASLSKTNCQLSRRNFLLLLLPLFVQQLSSDGDGDGLPSWLVGHLSIDPCCLRLPSRSR